jgi:ribose/xylose/arabinose/galactoside ABC-type transport system permease subunit
MGVLILTCLTSGLIILDVAAYWQGVLKGAGVGVDVLFNNRS